MRRGALAGVLLALAAPAVARDSLGMFGEWGAFRDPAVPRCYAIAMAQKGGGYLDVGTWPARGLRGKVHVRLSKPPADAPRLALGGQHFALVGSGSDAWPADALAEAAIVAAMRSSTTLTVSARDRSGHLFTDSYGLGGAASAIDAALVGCARR